MGQREGPAEARIRSRRCQTCGPRSQRALQPDAPAVPRQRHDARAPAALTLRSQQQQVTHPWRREK